MPDHAKIKKRAALISVASNTFLVLSKLAIGLFSGSVSIISEAIHSGVDLVASAIAYVAVANSSKPADREHRFGHGKYENISGMAEAVLIFAAAGWIIIEAAHKLLNPQPITSMGLGVMVMGVSSVVNIGVSRMLFSVGKRTDSVALVADAWHLLTDVYTSAGVMAGLLIIWLGHTFLPGVNLYWIDPAAAIIVAGLIIKAAYSLTMESAKDLLDHRLPENEENEILKKLSELRPQLKSFKNLQTRKAGHVRFITIDAVVEGLMPVSQAHDITDLMTEKIVEVFPEAMITVHIEPCKRLCEEDCRAWCSETTADEVNGKAFTAAL